MILTGHGSPPKPGERSRSAGPPPRTLVVISTPYSKRSPGQPGSTAERASPPAPSSEESFGDKRLRQEPHLSIDGEKQERRWKIKKVGDNRYEGTASDVVGVAKGVSFGSAFKFEYKLLVPYKDKKIKIRFDDWIFKQDEKVAINRATMTKFGIKVAELTVFFQKN